MMQALERALRQGMSELDLALSDAQVASLLIYLALIEKWTKVYNLTAIRDPAEMLTHHLLDSLAVIKPLRAQLKGRRLDGLMPTCHGESLVVPPTLHTDHEPKHPSLRGASATRQSTDSGTSGVMDCRAALAMTGLIASVHEKENACGRDEPCDVVGSDSAIQDRTKLLPTTRLLDVGSGAGLPGVVIAICCPDITVHCVDTVGKKAAFIQQVAVTLKLFNLRGIHARVENLTDRYQVISSRAFASLLDFTTWSINALAEPGIWMALKGKDPAEEIAALPSSVHVFHVEQLQVPGLDAERCIVWLEGGLQC